MLFKSAINSTSIKQYNHHNFPPLLCFFFHPFEIFLFFLLFVGKTLQQIFIASILQLCSFCFYFIIFIYLFNTMGFMSKCKSFHFIVMGLYFSVLFHWLLMKYKSVINFNSTSSSS